MNKISFLSTVCALSLLTACDHYTTRMAEISPPTIQSVEKIEPAAGGFTTSSMTSGMTYRQILAGEYYTLAKYEQEQMYDYPAAKYYFTKVEKLNQGHMVSPAKLNDFEINGAQASELSDARAKLVSALKTYNIPENRYALARAQTQFDCWAEQQAEERNEGAAMACKNEFLQSLVSLTPPNFEVIKYAVPFSSNEMALTEEGQGSIAQLLSDWKESRQDGASIILRPGVQTVPPTAANQASMIRSILQFNGVPAPAIERSMAISDGFVIELKKPKLVQPEESSI